MAQYGAGDVGFTPSRWRFPSERPRSNPVRAVSQSLGGSLDGFTGGLDILANAVDGVTA